MTELGISRFGAYVPRLRLDRSVIAAAHAWMAPGLKGQAKGSRAFTSWDEDAITMGVEAARDALGQGDAAGVQAVRLASTHLPYADLQNAAIVARAIGVAGTVATSDVTGSQRAGTSALLQALKGGEVSLVIGSDNPFAKPASVQELGFGAGAAAFLVSDENIAARLIGSATVVDVFVDHFRFSAADSDYNWEERWVRDEGYAKIVPAAVNAALADAQISIGDVQHFVMPSYLKGAADAVARKLKFAGTVASGLEDGVGYAGAAQALLMLAATLEKAQPGERIMLVGFGQGADVLIFQATDAIKAAQPVRGVAGAIADALPTDSYLRMLSFYNGIEAEWGMRSEKSGKTPLTEQYRSANQMEGFNAGKCGSCGTVQFPQLQYCVTCHAPGEGFINVPLRDEQAEVLTSTADWLSYHPSPPLWVGFVRFDSGARVLMEMVDIGKDGIDTGAKLRMVYRIKEKDRQRGYNRYFWKATPLGAA
ncbi:3-oxoacyl-[acyl-carrier-protein] synthase III C-terminal domain-containing protein (plasmid) [Sphingobium sp. SJ10-10]|uniref:3-oxoacyl-[acyl-carrier-protein] synthase III C-terminal domain-containing protein n=1 Tax=Sphingobium sp. SJ10-10 TaxID=3114999 RepID=UPI002E19E10A|nr:3-oxoacyl-[acyl-carrier-protein] synthase III C-terminal domain-containing protein [Sphingobium sp. SJ10-10]